MDRSTYVALYFFAIGGMETDDDRTVTGGKLIFEPGCCHKCRSQFWDLQVAENSQLIIKLYIRQLWGKLFDTYLGPDSNPKLTHGTGLQSLGPITTQYVYEVKFSWLNGLSVRNEIFQKDSLNLQKHRSERSRR